MKQKFEKVMELTPITMYSPERAKEIAKKWTHKGLDYLKEMWHKYYTTKAHFCIHSLLNNFSEKSLNLECLDYALECVCKQEESK